MYSILIAGSVSPVPEEAMSSLKTVEKQPLEELLEMSGGYVLDFTNHTFAAMFAETVGRDIYSSAYEKYGDSKAKRLRAFWEMETDAVVGKVLSELLEVWAYKHPEPSPKQIATAGRCKDIVGRLLGKQPSAEEVEAEFLSRDFKDLAIETIPIEASLIPILKSRFEEARRSLQAGAPLAAIFMCGSVLEGLLLGTALADAQRFNQATSSPKDKANKVKSFPEWSLAQLIDVSFELGYLKLDVKKFSHGLRDFRNYIHPFQQMSSRFSPDKHTGEICFQVLKAAIASLSGARGS